MYLKVSCILIGTGHLVLIALSLYERIWELIKLEEPFQVEEHTFIMISYIVQLLAIFFLIFGSITENSYFILPWLFCTTPSFILATTYAFIYTSKEETNQLLLNLVVVGVIWSTWYVAVRYYVTHNKYKTYTKLIDDVTEETTIR